MNKALSFVAGFLVVGVILAVAKPPAPAAQAPAAQPVLPRKALTEHLLPLNANWLQYYDVAPRDTVQLYYNVWTALQLCRQQEGRINVLEKRIAALERKINVPPSPEVSGQAAPDPNAPSAPAITQGGPTEKKAVD